MSDRKKAIETLKENLCAMCAYGSQNMEPCDIRSCDNRDAIKALEQEPTTKNDLGVDCVARQDVERYIEGFINEYTPKKELEFINLELDGLKHLPSVTPQEPRKGHWVEEFNDLEGEVRFTCSSCGKYQLFGTDFCYNCGSDNKEVEE